MDTLKPYKMNDWLKLCSLWISIFPSQLSAGCPDRTWVSHKTNGFCYKFFGDQRYSWTKSEYMCQQYDENAHLVSVHSKEEMDFIFGLINDSNSHWQHDDHFHHYAYMSDFAWIGLTTFCPENDRGKWTDGSRVDYSLLKTPLNVQKSEKCVAYYISAGKPKWVSKFCGSSGPYLCKVAQNGSLPTEQEADSEDLCGGWRWCRFEEKCYKIDTVPKVWLDAKSLCHENGADLLSVHSEDELFYVLHKFLSGWDADESFWTGLNKYESMDERFRWSDNTPLDYVPKMTIEYLEWRTASCVMLSARNVDYVMEKTGQVWKLDRCDKKHMSVCWKQSKNFTNPSLSTIPSAGHNKLLGYCRPQWTRYGNKCYKAYGVKNGQEKATFFNASSLCYAENAHLVSIKDVYENFFVLSLVNGAESSWIGLIYQTEKLQWLDETKISFVSFDANSLALYAAPENEIPPNNNRAVQRCFAMSVEKTPGFWDPIRTVSEFDKLFANHNQKIDRIKRTSVYLKRSKSLKYPGIIRTTRANHLPRYIDWRQHLTNDRLCEKEKMSFVCEQAVSSKVVPSITKSDLSCQNSSSTSKTIRYGSDCYEFFSNAKSWNESEKNCKSLILDGKSEYNSSHLLSIHSMHDFAFITSRAKELGFEEFWIGFRDKDFHNFLWSDDWPESFTHWGKGEPRNDPNSDNFCVKTFINGEDGGEWIVTNCDTILPFICKKTSSAPPHRSTVQGTCPDKWFHGSSQCYKIISEDWTSGSLAMLKCWREHNATLASFQNSDDISRLIKRNDIIHALRRFLIGLIQKIDGRYEWLNGDPVVFTNWAPGEPRYAWNSDVEVCVEMDHTGLWYDTGCLDSSRHYICSTPKIPIATANVISTTTTTSMSVSTSSLIKQSTFFVTQKDQRTISSQNSMFYSSTTLLPKQPYFPHFSKNSTNSTVRRSDFLASSKKSPENDATTSGSRWAVALCSTFLIACFLTVIFFTYKRRLWLRRWINVSRDPTSMRFEILNETDDI